MLNHQKFAGFQENGVGRSAWMDTGERVSSQLSTFRERQVEIAKALGETGLVRESGG